AIENMKKQIAEMEEQLRQLQKKVDEETKAKAAAPEKAKPAADEQRIKRLEEKLDAAVSAARTATKKTLLSEFNPAIGLIIDTIGSYQSRSQSFNRGNGPSAGLGINNGRPAGADFNLRSAELAISADVDPFVRAYAIINASADATRNDEATLSVEEAAIVTTRLPYNLTVRGGRFFANFGSLSFRHDHDLPFVDRPPSLTTFVGGESQTNGVEVSWLAPTATYLRFTAAVGNKLGANTQDPALNTLNIAPNNASRPLNGLTYIGRIQTYFDITDDHNLEVGTSIVETPRADNVVSIPVPGPPTGKFERRLVGGDFKYRWYPLGSGVRQAFTLSGEILYDVGDIVPGGDRRVNIFGQQGRSGAWGGYVYAEYRLSKQWRPGFRFDYFQLQSEPMLVTNPGTGLVGSTINRTGNQTDNRTWSPYLTWFPSEFQRLRLQYNRSSAGNARPADEFFLQWTVTLGAHAHGFSERE
ncbi:MAG TPA: porin, partial [Nitrospiraceae bacterium]|nr:porin [Nitrospiraceae bacterium]